MPSKSIFRQPGAKHFQLVHRSQRDPLINDPDASTHVLKPIKKESSKNGKSRAELETILTLDEISDENIGEASLYGVYFDDTEYDYMQHLRTVGTQEDGIESILIEAPVTSKRNAKAEPTSKKGLDFFDLPEGVLASTSEVPRNFETQQAIPDSIAGFQPDMDPHLRQALEALDDEAFVDEDLDDNFFSKLVGDGERDSDEGIDFQFTTEGITVDDTNGVEEESWEKRFSDFKTKHKNSLESDSDYSDGDTVGELPATLVIGGKKRRKGSSDASGYSMSSSSMYRTEALQTLDERFDQIMLREYQDKSDQDNMSRDREQSDAAPELITSRSDFDCMVNNFLNNYEILGRKMRLKLEGGSGLEKLDILRRSMGQNERAQIVDVEIEDKEDVLLSDQDDEKARWDCETILTTYTNLENHPRLIRARHPKPVPKFQLDHKTGLPSVLSVVRQGQKAGRGKLAHAFAESDDIEKTAPPQTARPRNESREDKKQRKSAVKQGKQARRTERKTTKQQFGAELKEQKRRIGSREQKVKKL